MLLRRLLAVSFASVLLAGTIAGCSGKEKEAKPEATGTAATKPEATETVDSNMVGNMYKTGLPIVKDKVTLNFTVVRPASYKNSWSEMEVFKELEEKTNVHIEFNEISDTAWNEKTKLMLASGDLPDAFYGQPIDDKVVYSYGTQGILLPLEGLIDQYSVNMKKYMADRPELKTMMTSTDGHIYGLPTVAESAFNKLGDIMFINQEWLKNVGMSAPTTTDELYEVLKAFRDKDPNGNGKADEIPFTFSQYQSPNVISGQNSISSLFGAFGVLDSDNHLMVKDGKLQFVPTQQGYLDGVRFFNKLYAEKLIDPESFAQNAAQQAAKARSKEGVGFTITGLVDNIIDMGDKAKTWTLEDYKTNRYQTLLPLKGPNGDQLWTDGQYLPGFKANTFMLTKDSKYPEVALRWLDYLLDNGTNSLIMRNGLQDKEWQYVDGDKWTTPVKDAPAITTTTHSPGQATFWLLKDINDRRVNDPKTQNKQNQYVDHQKYMNPEPLPPLKFEDDELSELATIEIDLKKYVESSMVTFIIGGVTDSAWNDYLEKVKSYKADRYVQIYQQAYDRFLKS